MLSDVRIIVFDPSGSFTAVVSSAMDTISIEMDDNHCVGDDLFEVHGRTAYCTVIDTIRANYYLRHVVPDGYYDFQYVSSAPRNTRYLYLGCKIVNVFTSPDQSDDVFTGLVPLSSVKYDAVKGTIEFQIVDAAWVWIDNLRGKTQDYAEHTPVFMNTSTDPHGLTNFGEICKAGVAGFSDFGTLHFDFSPTSTMSLLNQLYVMPSQHTPFDQWTSHISGDNVVLYKSAKTITWTDQYHSALNIALVKVWHRYLGSGLYTFSFTYLKFGVSINALGLPYGYAFRFVQYSGTSWDQGIPLISAYLNNSDICYAYVNEAGPEDPTRVLVIPETTDLQIDNNRRIFWSESDHFWRYDTLGSFYRFVISGNVTLSDLIKGMMSANNLTCYASASGHIWIRSRVPFWEALTPLAAFDTSSLISISTEGTVYDLDRLLDSTHLFEGWETMHAALSAFYASITSLFVMSVSIEFDPGVLGFMYSPAPSDVLMQKLSIDGKELFIISYSSRLFDDTIKMKLIGGV